LLLYRRAIKLNHEYLADKKVISHFPDILNYKKQLLHHAILQKSDGLVSTFNVSFTKKRLDMMSKKKSPVSIVLKQLLLVPLTLCLFLLITDTVTAQTTEPAPKKEKPSKVNKAAKKQKAVKAYPAPSAVPTPPKPPAPPSASAAPNPPQAPPAPPAPVAASVPPSPPAPPAPPAPRAHPVKKEKQKAKSKQKSKVSKNKGL
jgi:type IV secretory pathway VirB10-like protein